MTSLKSSLYWRYTDQLSFKYFLFNLITVNKIMNANSCPCCSDSMLLHLTSRRSYWFCRHCRLEIPNFKAKGIEDLRKAIQLNPSSIKAAIAHNKSTKPVTAI